MYSTASLGCIYGGGGLGGLLFLLIEFYFFSASVGLYCCTAVCTAVL